MTAEAPALLELKARRPFPPRLGPKGNLIYKLITTTDHKLIGIMYVVACFAFFLIGGLMALFIRTELVSPGLQFLSNEQYNQLFTMHGTAMLLFYATPIVFGFANLVLPLQIGAPDVAFPRLNAFSFWLFLFGALIALSGRARTDTQCFEHQDVLAGARQQHCRDQPGQPRADYDDIGRALVFVQRFRR